MPENIRKIKNDSPLVSTDANHGERGTVTTLNAGMIFNNNAPEGLILSPAAGILPGVL